VKKNKNYLIFYFLAIFFFEKMAKQSNIYLNISSILFEKMANQTNIYLNIFHEINFFYI